MPGGRKPKSVQPSTRTTLAEKMGAFRRQSHSTGIDWRAVSATSLRAAIAMTLAEGGAIMFGSAMGGRGCMMKVFLGDENWREYTATAEETAEYLDNIAEALSSGSEDVKIAFQGGSD